MLDDVLFNLCHLAILKKRHLNATEAGLLKSSTAL